MYGLILNLFRWEIGFDRPWYLLLLVLLPLLWVFSFKSLASLGVSRRFVALTLRSLVTLLIILAIAGIQWRRINDRVTVIYVLDQSLSIPAEQRQAMLDYVEREVREHRKADREDMAGVIVFGREAAIEVPPFDDDIFLSGSIESVGLRSDATNLASALKLAQASFPEGTAKRIVIVSDGNENIGNALAIAPMLSEDGVGIDVVPVRAPIQSEVDVAKVVLPTDIRRGQAIEARVVVNNYSDVPVSGMLKITRRVGQSDDLLDEQNVTLKPGKNVFSIPHRIDQPAVYTYRADFTADDPTHDLMNQNNSATAFTHVRGKGRVLLIEDWQNKGEFDLLVERLRANNIEVTMQPSNELFTGLDELQAYDSVILANVPRSSGSTADDIVNFSDEQIRMLVRNTEHMGCGLVMLGGPRSFGAGGWADTEIEKALPVDFTIKNSKVEAVGALVLLMHASEMANGNFWQKQVAVKSINMLGPMDYCGLIHLGAGGHEWLWGGNVGLIRVGNQKPKMMQAVSRMTPGDMPDFEPSMVKALAAFNRTKASVRHMIVVSDGDPTPPKAATLKAYAAAKVQVSTVAIGSHGRAGSSLLQKIATQTGGKYYVVKNAKALPAIYEQEVRRVARPLIKENINVSPQLQYPHEMTLGIEAPLPRIKGFVMTTLKQNPLVEVSLRSPEPEEPTNATILASWNYGLGRTVAYTTDCGKRWSPDWTQWENYDKFFTQMIRWSMRPVNEDENFSVATNVKDGKVQVVVTALDKDDNFLNYLNMSGVVVDPGLKETLDVKMRQVAPGRYLGEFESDKAGSYFVTISPGIGRAPLLAGVTVPYSAEFTNREPNIGLIKTLVNLQPEGGQPGAFIDGELTSARVEDLLATDTFRATLPKAVSPQDVWFLVMMAACGLFFADVFVRRVQVSFDWLQPLWQRLMRRRQEEQPADDRLERLRSRKAEVSDQIDDLRASARFETQPTGESTDAPRLDELLDDNRGADRPAARPSGPPQAAAPEQDDSYMSRLRKAKKEARQGPD